MRKVTYPTRVVLSEIPHEGRNYLYDQDGGDLNQALDDLIGDAPFKVDLHLKPIGNVYEIAGTILTERQLPCSRCGEDTKSEVKINLHELIVVEKERPRKSSSSHVSHSEEASGPFCNYISQPILNLGEFVHEQIAASEPYTIYCQRPDCEEIVIDKTEGFEKQSPFAILKDLKSRS